MVQFFPISIGCGWWIILTIPMSVGPFSFYYHSIERKNPVIYISGPHPISHQDLPVPADRQNSRRKPPLRERQFLQSGEFLIKHENFSKLHSPTQQANTQLQKIRVYTNFTETTYSIQPKWTPKAQYYQTSCIVVWVEHCKGKMAKCHVMHPGTNWNTRDATNWRGATPVSKASRDSHDSTVWFVEVWVPLVL